MARAAPRRAPAPEPVQGLQHLRIISPSDRSDAVLEVLRRAPGVSGVVVLPGAARVPEGDLLTADVSREATSLVIDELCALGIPERGAVSIEEVAGGLSAAAWRAERAAPGSPGDAVVWEQVEATTSESVVLNGSFLVFIVAATVLAAIGLLLDSPILIIGAMITGPEFGPLAGVCVAAVAGRRELAVRSLRALAVGFPLAIALTLAVVAALRAAGVAPDDFSEADHTFAAVIASPDAYTVIVALVAGVVGMLSLSTAKSSVLIGVLVSVTTIPAAANVAVSATYAHWGSMGGSLAQLGLNLALVVVAGTLTLALQRRVFVRRRAEGR